MFLDTAQQHFYCRRAYLRLGKYISFFRCLSVFRDASSADKARRIARVFFARKSSGTCLPQVCLRRRAFWFWLYTVKTRAIDLRTTLILASSFFRSSNLFRRGREHRDELQPT